MWKWSYVSTPITTSAKQIGNAIERQVSTRVVTTVPTQLPGRRARKEQRQRPACVEQTPPRRTFPSPTW